MGLRIGVRVLSWIQLPILSDCLHRLTSRFFLNLRNIASHQQQTTLGADAPSALSALRPRPTRKQRGQPTTDIFDLSVDNTTFNKETDPSEEASQQTEVFDLAVIESQNQPNGDKHH